MGNKPKILIDINIILDVLQKREPFYEHSAQVLASAETGRIIGAVAGHTITTLFYLLEIDKNAGLARVAVTELLKILRVAGIDQQTIEQGLSLAYEDFEDAVQMMSAAQFGADYLITRNPKDYKEGPVSTLTPVEFLALFKGEFLEK